jgi:DNA-binding NarL/FixJ family response regulator
VLIADDHAMVRQGLRSVLEGFSDIDVVGEASNGREAVDLTERFKPSAIVMDINMPLMNGIEATATIKTRHPDIVVIGMSVNASVDNHDAMRTAGASMLLTKEAAVDQLHGAIQRAVQEADAFAGRVKSIEP